MPGVIQSPLACTARDCGLLLEQEGRVLRCARGHSYDIARSGYVNLLQPHDRRSLSSGDAKDAVAARARLLDAGVGRRLLEDVADRAAALDPPGRAVIADLGSGTGDALATLAERRAIDGIGIDLSTFAAEHAARRFPEMTWVVANADRRLPLLERSVDLVLSINGRRNPKDCARVLTACGRLLVAVPASDDLSELRERLLGQPVERDRVDTVIAEHQQWFQLLERAAVRERRQLERDALADLLRSTYRGARQSSAKRIEELERLEVTLAFDILLFRAV
jgi:23S rRNA (guanine745-N1)-methyltransferase